MGYSPYGCKESAMTERLTLLLSLIIRLKLWDFGWKTAEVKCHFSPQHIKGIYHQRDFTTLNTWLKQGFGALYFQVHLFPLSLCTLEECHRVQTAPKKGRHLHYLLAILLFGKYVHSLMFVRSFICLFIYLLLMAQLSSVAQSCPIFATSWTAARQASLSITNSRSLLKLMSIELVMPSSHLILCHPLLLLPSTPPSIRVFSIESVLHIRWPKYWSFSFSISPSSEIQDSFPLG